MNSPSMTNYEIELSQLDKVEMPREAQTLLDIIAKFKDSEHQDQ